MSAISVPVIPDLAALYAVWPALPQLPTTLPMFTITPAGVMSTVSVKRDNVGNK